MDSGQNDIDAFLRHSAPASTQMLDVRGRMTDRREDAVEIRATKKGGPRGGVVTIRVSVERARRLRLISWDF